MEDIAYNMQFIDYTSEYMKDMNQLHLEHIS